MSDTIAFFGFLLGLFVSRKLEMDAQMIRNELDSRTISASI